jgi:hemoglobin
LREDSHDDLLTRELGPTFRCMTFGVGDSSFRAAGGLQGLTQLVDAFYGYMETLPEAARIRAMHPDDLTLSRRKLTTFLCGWLGGPKLFIQEFGPISIPGAHAHFPIDEPERDAWLACMRSAVAEQPWDVAFQAYFLSAIAVPAERVRVASVARRCDEAPAG